MRKDKRKKKYKKIKCEKRIFKIGSLSFFFFYVMTVFENIEDMVLLLYQNCFF